MGAVLAGGESSRMGTDKAFIAVDGEPMVLRAARTLQEAGAQPTVVVGGDEPRLKQLGLATLADDHPGEGPLGAVITVLRHLHETGAAGSSQTTAAVVTLPCDVMTPDAAAIRCLLESFAADCAETNCAETHAEKAELEKTELEKLEKAKLKKAELIVPLGDGEPQWMHALWLSSCRETLSAAFSEGVRAPREAARRLRTVTVEVPGSGWFDDADRPEDLS